MKKVLLNIALQVLKFLRVETVIMGQYTAEIEFENGELATKVFKKPPAADGIRNIRVRYTKRY